MATSETESIHYPREEHLCRRPGEELLLLSRQMVFEALHTEILVHINEDKMLERIISHVETILGHDVTQETERSLDVSRRTGPVA